MIKSNKPISEIRLLSQGTYGCVFYPGIGCSGKLEKKQYITKVQKKENTSENELKIGNYIKKIKLYGMYFAPILKTCPIQLAKIEKEEIKKCDLFDIKDLDENKKNMKYISNKIRYVGENTLQKHLMIRLHSDIHTFFPHFLETHIFLLNSVQKLVNINILHYDIKENNIIYDEMNHSPVLIDFGLSFNVKELVQKSNFEKAFYIYYDKYSPWCLDIALISFIVTEKEWDTRSINIEKLNTVIDSYFANNEVMVISNNTKPYINQWKTFIRKNIHKKGMYFVNELLKHWNTWDHYSVSVMYFFMIYDFEWINEPFLLQYRSMLTEHILSVPSKRMSFDEMIDAIRKIGVDKEYNDWIQKTVESTEIAEKQKSRFLEKKKIEQGTEKIIYGGNHNNHI
jgi:tRNA A-37 threonylcarbamoyl transferase component Bud32